MKQMSALDIILSILLNLCPIAVFAIPIPFLKKKKFGLIYNRFFYGLCLFFLVYWVLPVLFQSSWVELEFESGSQGNAGIGIAFLLLRSLDIFLLFLQYPFVVLPFIFIISPIFSILVLRRRLKKEPGDSIKEKLKELTYEYEKSPKELIIEGVTKKDWGKEKEIMKTFLILLPISLYLLVVILDIASVDTKDIMDVSTGSTALGWFMEILFVYLATFLYVFVLLKSSKVSYAGRFVGEQVQNRFFSSLNQVGTPISILFIILFMVQETQSLPALLFFSAYFIMAAFIFVILLRIFEPISILIFVKLLNLWKIRAEKNYKPDYSNGLLTLLYSITAALAVIIISVASGFIIQGLTNTVEGGDQFLIEVYDSVFVGANPSFGLTLLTEGMILLGAITAIGVVMVLAYIFKRSIVGSGSNGISALIYAGVLLGLTIALSGMFFWSAPLPLATDKTWITGSPVFHDLFGFRFYTMRSAFLTSDLFQTNKILFFISTPFLYLRAIVNFLLWGMFLANIDKGFVTRKFKGETDNLVDKTTFSSRTQIITAEEFESHPGYYITAEKVVFTNEKNLEMLELHKSIRGSGGVLVKNILNQYPEDSTRICTTLSFMARKKYISCWVPEFSFTYERATLDGLYILYADGRDLVYHNFNKEQGVTVDPALVSGMFSAITAFIHETTKSTEQLAAIDSGDKKVLLEYSADFPVFAAMFADRETADIRNALKTTLDEFVARHRKILGHWNGSMEYFDNDEELVIKNFKEILE